MTHRFSGPAAAAYDAGRAPYVPEVVAALDLPAAPARVIDLAAGTGLLSRALLAAGHEVTAVEPDPEMASRLPDGAARVAARAEATELPEGCADAVVVGDAWHWFDGEAAAEEVHRVLRPRGRLAIVWRASAPEEHPEELAPFHARLGAAFETARDTDPVFDEAFLDERGLGRLRAHPGFAPLVQRSVRFLHRTTRAGLVAEAASASFVNGLADREALLRELDTDLASLAGPVEVPYVADVWRTTRRR